MEQAKTKEERFLLRVYKLTHETDEVMDRYEVGNSIGFKPKAVDTICNLLAQGNFIKKTGPTGIFLSSQGKELAIRLTNE